MESTVPVQDVLVDLWKQKKRGGKGEEGQGCGSGLGRGRKKRGSKSLILDKTVILHVTLSLCPLAPVHPPHPAPHIISHVVFFRCVDNRLIDPQVGKY